MFLSQLFGGSRRAHVQQPQPRPVAPLAAGGTASAVRPNPLAPGAVTTPGGPGHLGGVAGGAAPLAAGPVAGSVPGAVGAPGVPGQIGSIPQLPGLAAGLLTAQQHANPSPAPTVMGEPAQRGPIFGLGPRVPVAGTSVGQPVHPSALASLGFNPNAPIRTKANAGVTAAPQPAAAGARILGSGY